MRKLAWVFLGLFFVVSPCAAGSHAKPCPKDKCPVCGMFVNKYPEWLARIHLKDSKILFFDGAKDMFKFLSQPKKYIPDTDPRDLREIYVTDYYSLESIDGKMAFYVIGSNVYGPMGKELIPFRKEEDAKEFLRDHAGKRILRFQEVTPDILRELD